MVPMADGSAVMPEATVEATGSSRAKAGVANATVESRMKKPMVLGEQTALPEVSEGMVRHAVCPLSP